MIRRGTVMGAVLTAHIALIAYLIARQVPPYTWTPSVSEAPGSVLRVTLVNHRPAAGLAPPPSLYRRPPPTRQAMTPRHNEASRQAPPAALPATSVDESTAPDQAPTAATNQTTPPSFGDPTLRKALDAGGNSTSPRLPGYQTGSLVRGVSLAPSESIEHAVRTAGGFVSCSIIEMKRNRPGNGLNQQVLKAYSENGCKK